MSKIAIKAENISKAYQLGQFSTGTLSRDMERAWAKIRGKDDPFLKIGEINDRTQKGNSNIVWSLKDINFEIKKGDAVGIIGRNGAGKSTLLKILSRVTAPTTGEITGKGRIASLLEVGTGFHPELTGRENIYLNGAILGMRKHEIKRQFDQIVDFSGVERYIDTPVKRYSSGMYVRLAFAVAAHLESEILIVDEVLAVGDAEFQKKCLGKMGEVSKGEGKTVLFVSHNIGSIAQLCNKGMYLKNGSLEANGEITNILDLYVNQNNNDGYYVNDVFNNNISHFKKIYFVNPAGEKDINSFLFNDPINICFQIKIAEIIENLHLSLIVKDIYDVPIFASHYQINNETQLLTNIEIHAIVPKNTLLPSIYRLEPILHVPNREFICQIKDHLNFQVEDSGSIYTTYTNANLGKVVVDVKWTDQL